MVPVTKIQDRPDFYSIKRNKSETCCFSWDIDSYGTLVTLRMELLLISPKFSLAGDNLGWHLQLTHSYSSLETDTINASISVFPEILDNDNSTIEVHDGQLYAMKPDGSRIHIRTFSTVFCRLNQEEKYNLGTYPISEMNQWIFENKLMILLEIPYTREIEIGTFCTSMSSPSLSLSSQPIDGSIGDYVSDLTISVNGKDYPVHKLILASRSSVFNAMFKNDMLESRENRIKISDISQKTFETLLHYIYTNEVGNPHESAFELLPLADKYAIFGLTSECERILKDIISTDNAGQILVLADMHRCEQLKEFALGFIKQNYPKCEEFNDTEFWNMLTTSRAHLLKDMLSAFCDK